VLRQSEWLGSGRRRVGSGDRCSPVVTTAGVATEVTLERGGTSVAGDSGTGMSGWVLGRVRSGVVVVAALATTAGVATEVTVERGGTSVA
jgi:hypothetical protein